MQGGSISRAGRRRRQQRQDGNPLWRYLRNAFLVVCAVGMLAAVGVFAGFSYVYTSVSEELPELDNYAAGSLARTSIVYDAEDDVIARFHGDQNRFVVPIDEISPSLRNAAVAIEDRRFYQHKGMDFEAIGRAAVENLESLSVEEGGSTITQQFIKNTYIAQEKRSLPSFKRKIMEASLAWQYEEEHSKKEILEGYLNTVYFGEGAYGAEAASRTYFGKSASELTIAESALLSGLVKSPAAYNPYVNPEVALDRRNLVLDRMLEQGYITREEHESAVNQELQLSREEVEPENANRYFINAVRKRLAKEYGAEMVYQGGLRIHTTLDPRLQELANTAVDRIVNPEDGDPSASLVSVEPETGAVRALVGGSDFSEVKFNLATQAERQPGSAFKTFVLAEAIKRGISPEETEYVSEELKIERERAEDYEVRNYDDIERGPITIEKAIAASDNTVFVQLALDLGLEGVVEMAHKMGIEADLSPYPAIAIGGLTTGVSPLEMSSAYSTLANGGKHMEPYMIEKVVRVKEGGEKGLEDREPKGERALSKDEAAMVTRMLQGVVEEGTASYYRDLEGEIGRSAIAGKTGTSENFSDAWFIGYTPNLATSVWVGYPGERKQMVNINGLEEINGENYPLDIWSLYMQEAVQQLPEERFPVPSPDLDLKQKTDGRAHEPPDSEDSEDDETTSEEGEESPLDSVLDILDEDTEAGGESTEPQNDEETQAEDEDEEPQSGEPVRIPDVDVYFDSAARDILQDAGFKVEVVRQPNPNYKPGIAWKTEPAIGSTAPKGSTVTVYATPG